MKITFTVRPRIAIFRILHKHGRLWAEISVIALDFIIFFSFTILHLQSLQCMILRLAPKICEIEQVDLKFIISDLCVTSARFFGTFSI